MDKRLQRQIAHAFEHAPATRERLTAAKLTPDDFQTVADLQKLPIFSKDDAIKLQQANPPFGGMATLPLNEMSHLFFSPGPLYEPEAADDDDTQLRMAQFALQQSGFSADDIVINTLSYHLVPAGLLVDRALRSIGCTVIPGGVGNSDLQLKMMRDFGVSGYVGTPSFLGQLLEKATAQNAPVSSLKRVFFTAEPLPASLRQQLVEQHGLTVGNAYATAELGFLALDTVGSMAMRLMPEPIIELVDPETGQCVAAGAVGEVTVTNFSRVYPLIRFGTGDMAVNLDPAAGKSSQGERAITLVGRSGEAVKVRGMFVHPNQLRFGAAQVTKFSAIQGVVTREAHRDRLVVRIAGNVGADASTLQAALQQVCRVKIDAIEFIDTIPADAAGMVDARDWL